eukprot:Filipodium_phascolosomae@DN8353_c0_g1_i1.p1
MAGGQMPGGQMPGGHMAGGQMAGGHMAGGHMAGQLPMRVQTNSALLRSAGTSSPLPASSMPVSLAGQPGRQTGIPFHGVFGPPRTTTTTVGSQKILQPLLDVSRRNITPWTQSQAIANALQELKGASVPSVWREPLREPIRTTTVIHQQNVAPLDHVFGCRCSRCSKLYTIAPQNVDGTSTPLQIPSMVLTNAEDSDELYEREQTMATAETPDGHTPKAVDQKCTKSKITMAQVVSKITALALREYREKHFGDNLALEEALPPLEEEVEVGDE